jgi:glycosyltransferase involved in cell wall biosynthesis
MRILHVSPSYYPATFYGGPIFSTYGLNNALAAIKDLDLKILTTDSNGTKISDRIEPTEFNEMYPDQNVFIERRITGASVSPALVRRLPGLIRWADLVHLTATYSFPTIPTLIFSRLYRKPVVWSLRGAILELKRYPNVRKKYLKGVWNRFCNAIIQSDTVFLHVTSDDEKKNSDGEINKARIFKINNGVDIPEFLPQKDSTQNMFRLLYLGRLHPIKSLENLISALEILNDSTLSLEIYGNGTIDYEKTLKTRVAALGSLSKTITFNGHVEGADKENAFRRADVCILPSQSENFGMVIAEALARSTPVLASTATPWQGVETQHCGLWVNNSPQALANAITSIRAMDLMTMGQNGKQWMQSEFGWDVIAKKMHGVYQDILDETKLW